MTKAQAPLIGFITILGMIFGDLIAAAVDFLALLKLVSKPEAADGSEAAARRIEGEAPAL